MRSGRAPRDGFDDIPFIAKSSTFSLRADCTMNFPRITPPPRLPGIHVPVPIQGLHARAWAQPENCVSGFTITETACSALTSRVDTCASVLAADNLKPMEQNPQFASCFCRQDLFSNIVVCKGIHRQCILDYAYDSDFDKYQSQWLDFCGSASPDLKVTTPPLPTVSVPRATNTCDYVKTACDRYTRYKDICASNYASHSINCNCQPQIQYVESICTIDGGALCATATPTVSGNGELSDLWAYKSCKTWLGIPGVSFHFQTRLELTDKMPDTCFRGIIVHPRDSSHSNCYECPVRRLSSYLLQRTDGPGV
jgi:hypothetical protein